MCMFTTFTPDTADAEKKSAGGSFDITVIITMNRQTSGMSTGTSQLVKLKVIYDFIIKIWC